MRRLRIVLAAMLAVVAILPTTARAQSVVIGDTTAVLRSLRSDSGPAVATEWEKTNRAKANALLSWVGATLGCRPVPQPASGFTNAGTIRYTRTGAGAPADIEFRLTFFPVDCSPGLRPRYPKATVAMALTRYPSTPTLAYPRLLVRFDNNSEMVEEYSLRKDGRVTKMTCKFGDCVFRTALHILKERNALAYRSLMNVFDNSDREKAFDTLRRMYDVRQRAVGQGALSLFSGILVVANLEEEFDAGYVDGTIDQAFKPVRQDSWAVAQAKQLAKDVLKNLLQEAGKRLWAILASWLGL